ncbi:MAG TPA: TlpA family protein disulfide reductase [Verrucomicrobiales bacterium]|nr:TlpA family protein disulfide reductase [Verrucomicrobiales bacterium]
MKKLSLLLTAITSIYFVAVSLSAQEKGDPVEQLKELVEKINVKLKAGERSADKLTEELKAFDVVLKEHEGEKTDDVAQILFMKAMLYLQVFNDLDVGTELVNKLKKEFPETEPGKRADSILEGIEQQRKAAEIQGKLKIGSVFPDFKVNDLNGKPLSIANYKGKVVLLDFWATWCGPCIGELPHVMAAYEKHHSKGFDIIGISLDRKLADLQGFIEKKKMPWVQHLNGAEGGSDLAQTYGINSIPATFLLDGEGKVIGRNLRGPALEAAVAKALATQ